MPYYFGEGDPGWDEDGEDEHRLPNVAQFRYLPPPEVGGPPDPVRFSDQAPPAPREPPAAPSGRAPSVLDRLLGRRPAVPAAATELTWREKKERSRHEEEYRSQYWLALLVTALREVGARRVYCRYDGGNDEGFAWLDHVELRSGERLAPDEVAALLAATELIERLATAQLWQRRSLSKTKELRDILDHVLAAECAARLLGGGYGTGPFYLYGALTVDLDACTIVDDRNADPIVANIQIVT